MPSSSKCAKTTGYTPEEVQKLLKSKRAHPVKGNWQDWRELRDVECFDGEIVWTASNCCDLNDDPIPALTFKIAVPRGMRGLMDKLQSIHGRNVSSLPRAVKDHFLVSTKARFEEINLKVVCNYTGMSCSLSSLLISFIFPLSWAQTCYCLSIAFFSDCCTFLFLILSSKFYSSDEVQKHTFTHLYCKICEDRQLPDIWKKHSEKLPRNIDIVDLFYNWDSLGRSHLDIDILGCLIPHKPGMLHALSKIFIIVQPLPC